MENLKGNKKLNLIFRELLKIETVKKVLSEERLRDYSFGFSTDFDIRDFFIFTNTKHYTIRPNNTECQNLEKIKQMAGSLLFYFKHNHAELPIYFKHEFFEIKICRKYYICVDVKNGTWGQLCITRSKKMRVFWIRQEKLRYQSRISDCKDKIKYFNAKIKELNDSIISFDKTIKEQGISV